MKYIICVGLAIVFSFHCSCATVNKTVLKEFYKNGKLKSLTIVKVKTPKNIDLFTFYKETKIMRTDFDSISGFRLKYTERYTKVGFGGRHCYEIEAIQILYDVAGKRNFYEKSKCDKHQYEYRKYINGKLVFIHIEKKRKRK